MRAAPAVHQPGLAQARDEVLEVGERHLVALGDLRQRHHRPVAGTARQLHHHAHPVLGLAREHHRSNTYLAARVSALVEFALSRASERHLTRRRARLAGGNMHSPAKISLVGGPLRARRSVVAWRTRSRACPAFTAGAGASAAPAASNREHPQPEFHSLPAELKGTTVGAVPQPGEPSSSHVRAPRRTPCTTATARRAARGSRSNSLPKARSKRPWMSTASCGRSSCPLRATRPVRRANRRSASRGPKTKRTRSASAGGRGIAERGLHARGLRPDACRRPARPAAAGRRRERPGRPHPERQRGVFGGPPPGRELPHQPRERDLRWMRERLAVRAANEVLRRELAAPPHTLHRLPPVHAAPRRRRSLQHRDHTPRVLPARAALPHSGRARRCVRDCAGAHALQLRDCARSPQQPRRRRAATLPRAGAFALQLDAEAGGPPVGPIQPPVCANRTAA